MLSDRTPRPAPRPVLRIAAGVAVVFGLLTIASGGRALFGGADMGAVVPFVLWFNFLAGFAYVAAGLGLWFARPWGWFLSLAILAATVVVGLAFAFIVLQGAPYEMRTAGALVLRAGIWAVIAAIARPVR